MKEEERQKRIDFLFPYIGSLTASLGLREWQIRIPNEYCDDADAWATVTRISRTMEAVIRLNDNFLEATPIRQRQVLLHELIHLWFRLTIEAREGLPDLLGQPVWLVVAARFDAAEEHAVDGLSRALVEYFPLPPVYGEEVKVEDAPTDLDQARGAVVTAASAELHRRGILHRIRSARVLR